MAAIADAFVSLRLGNATALKSETESAMTTAGKSGGAKGGAAAGAGFLSNFQKETTKGLPKTTESFGSQLGTTLGKASEVGALGLVAIGAASLKMAADFQKGLTTLVTGAGESERNLALVGAGIKRIAMDSGTATKDLIDGMYMIESAGFHGADGLKVLSAAAQGAKLSNADLGTVADAVTTVMKDYGLSGDKATNATNALITTVARGKTHLQDLASSMARILPVASRLGIGMGQVGGAMATMTSEGTSARLAAMGLNATILAMASPTSVATKQVKALGGTSAEIASTLQKHGLIAALQMVNDLALKAGSQGSPAYVSAMKAMLGGTNGLRVGLQLTGSHMKDLEANTVAVSGSFVKGGSTVTGWALAQKDASLQFDKFKATLSVIAITIGQKLLPVVSSVLGFLNRSNLVIPLVVAAVGLLTLGFIAWTASMFASLAPLGSVIASVAKMALRAAVYAAGMVISAGATLAAWIAASVGVELSMAGVVLATGGVILIIAGLVVAAYELYRHWHTVWQDVSGAVAAAFRAIRGVFAAVVDVILAYYGMLLHGAASAFGWIPGIGGKLKEAAAAFDRFRQNVVASIKGIHGKTVTVGVAFMPTTTSGKRSTTGLKAAARGLYVSDGRAGVDDQLIMAQRGELVVPTRLVNAGMVDHLRGMIPGFAQGGAVGQALNVRASTPGPGVIQAAVMPPVVELARMFAKTMFASGGVFTSALGQAIAAYASQFAGRVPYVWGGSGPTGWDCSGFTSYVYDHFGFNSIPRIASAQQAWAQHTPQGHVGGLAFFAGADGTAASAGHVGIVVGPNRMVDAYGTGYGTIFNTIMGSSGAFGGYGVPPGAKFHRGGVLPEPMLGLGLNSGRSYQMNAGETITSERGLGVLAGLLAAQVGRLDALIGAVYDNAGLTASGVAGAIGGAAHSAGYRAAYSPAPG